MSYCPLTAHTLYKQRRETCRLHKHLEYASLHSLHPDLHSGVTLVARGNCRTNSVGAWVPSYQRPDNLPRYPRRIAESTRGFSEVCTSEATASRETASQERQRRPSWQVHAQLRKKLKRVTFYLPALHRPWKRGINENTKGLLWDFFSKGKDITNTPENYIQRKYYELNLRSRKCLSYKTPYEVYFSKVLHLA